MTIPDYQTVMLPLLQHLNDGAEHVTTECVEALARKFDLTQDEQSTLLASGRQAVFANRVGWAATYLAKAGLIQRSGRGRIRITARGQETVQSEPHRVDANYLTRFPEFVEFRRRTIGPTPGNGDEGEPTPPLPPNEQLEANYQRLRDALAQDLLDRIKQATPAFFEQVVLDLLVAMGYGGSLRDAAQAVGRSGDDGIDGIIKEDRLGLDFVYVQAKRWEGSVSRPIVQAFAGSLEGQRARKGVLITTSTFTREAKDYVTRIEKRIVLIDGDQLAQLMIDHGVGVADVAVYHVKRVDADYFTEGQG